MGGDGEIPYPRINVCASDLRYSGSMHGFVSKYGMQHALGDCYCDDWAIEDDWGAFFTIKLGVFDLDLERS